MQKYKVFVFHARGRNDFFSVNSKNLKFKLFSDRIVIKKVIFTPNKQIKITARLV